MAMLGDDASHDDVPALMWAWQGTTPDGYALRVERDSRDQWVVTIASVSRSRNDSLEAALMEAGGSSVFREWAARVAAVIAATATAEKLSERSAHSSHTEAT